MSISMKKLIATLKQKVEELQDIARATLNFSTSTSPPSASTSNLSIQVAEREQIPVVHLRCDEELYKRFI